MLVTSRSRLDCVGVALAGLALAAAAFAAVATASAATFGPPMLDITKQCDLLNRRNVTAMSECVVAESEARAEILRAWDSYPDASARKCIALGRKARRSPYGVMAKCLASGAVPDAKQPKPASPSPKP